MIEGGPDRAGTVAELWPRGDYPPSVAEKLKRETWCPAMEDYVPIDDLERLVISPIPKEQNCVPSDWWRVTRGVGDFHFWPDLDFDLAEAGWPLDHHQAAALKEQLQQRIDGLLIQIDKDETGEQYRLTVNVSPGADAHPFHVALVAAELLAPPGESDPLRLVRVRTRSPRMCAIDKAVLVIWATD
ncbi:MAG: hypothetical protein PVJ34_18955 [Anaerolineae bacterium]